MLHMSPMGFKSGLPGSHNIRLSLLCILLLLELGVVDRGVPENHFCLNALVSFFSSVGSLTFRNSIYIEEFHC